VLILNAIEQKVKARNTVNAARMASANTIPVDEVFERNSMVSLLIPIPLRLAGELRRVFCRVVQHTRTGYQLNTVWGLLSGRFSHNQLNGVENDIGDIPCLTVQAANTKPKIGLAKVVAMMNNRGPISTVQRAGRKKLLGKRNHSEGEVTSMVEAEPPAWNSGTRQGRGRGRRAAVMVGRMRGGRSRPVTRSHHV
jgi:hypothetical protein